MRYPAFPTPYGGEIVYHYTDAAGLIGIVENHALRATESTGLNDPREVLYGQAELAGHVAPIQYKKSFEFNRHLADMVTDDEVFVACATTRKDDVSQWDRYTAWPDAGYCIGLSTEQRLAVACPDTPPDRGILSASAGTSAWSSVLYGHQAFQETMSMFHPWAEHVAREVDTSLECDDYESEFAEAQVAAPGALIDLTRLAKDEGFATESEVRLVTTLRGNPGATTFRPSRYGVVRYVELAAGASARGLVVRDQDNKKSWARLPIVSVTIGPSPFAERGLGAVRRLLSDNGYKIEPTVSLNKFR